MCTLTFISSGENKIISSNRDEVRYRLTEVPVWDKKLGAIYPKDSLAGGTWIALKENGVFYCLLNGGFNNHLKKENYRHSRGLIILEAIHHNNLISFKNTFNFNNLEPFTLVCYNPIENILEQIVWDENEIHYKELNAHKNYIWSSVTLYSKEVRQHRKYIFNEFLTKKDLSIETIKELHLFDKSGFILQNNQGSNTVSFTQLNYLENSVAFNYEDFITNKQTKEIISCKVLE